MDSNFKVYRSSAGSGKTYTLALNFISLAISGHENWCQSYYKRILAITFTNKAAAEMKERVLDYLDVLGRGEDTDNILSWIINETSLDARCNLLSNSKAVVKFCTDKKELLLFSTFLFNLI